MNSKKITRTDRTILVLIVLIYSVVSFINLGDTVLPSTQPDMGDGDKKEYITYINLDGEVPLDRLLLFKGLGRCGVTVYKASDDGSAWQEIAKQVCEEIYTWEEIKLDCSAKRLCISVGGDKHAELFEAAFKAKNGALVPVHTNNCQLFDEQELVPSYISHKSGTYFDETYHVRTAYEHIRGIYPYEISHPPLGKLIISLGMCIFGINPFGWRIMGNICGILMLVVMYLLSKRIFKSSYCAFAATAFLALDFMHFTQTRIATIDSFAVFFIMLMYYFMYIYYDDDELSYKDTLKILAACGISFGLGVSVKWICIYAGAGLAVLFVLAALKHKKQGKPFVKTCLWCILFFVAVPAVIYFLSYIPYFVADADRSAFKVFWDNQMYMLNYHSGLDATHDFASKWYTWPAIVHPMWYFGSKELAYSGLCSSIAAMGNPALWWIGSACAVFLVIKFKKTRAEWFIIISFISQYLPWVFVTRPVFIYHFFASVPFIILALVWVLKKIADRFKYGWVAAAVLIAAAAVLFVMFYPVISGAVCGRGYVLNILSWFKSWNLCY